jgi:hypothetical protein
MRVLAPKSPGAAAGETLPPTALRFVDDELREMDDATMGRNPLRLIFTTLRLSSLATGY